MLYEKLKKLRLEKGWDQQTIADKIDITQSEYSKIENGKANPDMGKLIKLSKIYSIDLNELLELNVTNNFHNYENSKSNNYGYINQLQIQENEITILKSENVFLRKQNEKLISIIELGKK